MDLHTLPAACEKRNALHAGPSEFFYEAFSISFEYKSFLRLGTGMVAAHRLILVRPPHTNLLGLLGRIRFPRGVNGLRAVLTPGTERTEFVDMIAVGDEFQELAEGFGGGIAVQAHTNYMLLFGIDGAHDELLQVRKELGLFNNEMGGRSEFGGL